MYDNTPAGALRLSRTAIVVISGETEERVNVVAKSGEWNATEDAEWLAIERDDQAAIISIDAYPPTEPQGDEEQESRTAVVTFTSGGESVELNVTQLPEGADTGERHPEYEINRAIHEQFLAPLYYEDEARTVPADYNQSYRDFWNNYLENLDRNELDGGEWATGKKRRYIYSFVEKHPAGTAAADTPRLGYGMEFDLGNYDGKLVGRVLYVDEGGPAQRAGLKRGDWFWKVNDIEMQNYEIREVRDSAVVYKLQYNRTIDSLVKPVEGVSPTLGMLEFNMAGERLEDRGRKVVVTPERFRSTPVLHSSTIVAADVTTGEAIRMGYLVLTRFDERYEAEIKNAFAGFENLTHFVLDLRYNRSGSARVTETVGNLLVPEAARGMTFARYESPTGSRTVAFEPEAGSVAVDTIVVLTGPRTAGGSELLINALRGIEPTVKLLVVGDLTQGMSVGMARRMYATTSWEYDTWTASARTFNAAGEGEYGYGFVPNGGTVGEWSGTGTRWSDTWGWKPVQGMTQDPLLFRAMELITGTSRMPTNGVLPSSRRERGGYPREYEYPTNMIVDYE